MVAYRLFQIRDGRPTTLFHGVDHDRTLPIGEWIEAEVEEVFDGSGGTTYQSGFHVLPTRSGAVDYLRTFSRGRPIVVCTVQVEDTWEKAHSPSDVLLARHMYIPPMKWAQASNPIGEPAPVGRRDREKKKEAAKEVAGPAPAVVGL